MKIELSVRQEDVYEEVAKTTSYTGTKKDQQEGSETAYDTMATTDEDAAQLDRFWEEGWIQVGEALKRYVEFVPSSPFDGTIAGKVHKLSLNLSSSFDTSLINVMNQELRSFMVNFIIAKWFSFTNKGEATEYATEAGGLLEGLQRKACYKKRPTRPSYD